MKNEIIRLRRIRREVTEESFPYPEEIVHHGFGGYGIGNAYLPDLVLDVVADRMETDLGQCGHIRIILEDKDLGATDAFSYLLGGDRAPVLTVDERQLDVCIQDVLLLVCHRGIIVLELLILR